MDEILEKIANGETLTSDEWYEMNGVLEDALGWDGIIDCCDDEERIRQYVLILAKEKLNEFDTVQLLEVLGY